MGFYADLHIHSKYSRATSKDLDLEHLSIWAQRKGITVVGTGDFTHPAWFEELNEKLVPAEEGLFRLRPEIECEVRAQVPPSCRGEVRFLLQVEISTIYKKGDKTRKIHHLIYAPDLDAAGRFRNALDKIGNIRSDGRPILGLDSRDLLEITLESGDGAYLVPAHIWTPWFAVLGSKGGFDSIEACYGDLSEHIFAVETGLSSDPPMNWRLSALDRYTLISNSDAHSPGKLGREACVFDTEMSYGAIRRALETGQGYEGTVEFYPEEGKYHLDGHRNCEVCLEPSETRACGGRCPTCGKPLTVGVLHRVEDLADQPEGRRPEGAHPFRSLVPLPEILSELRGVGPKSKTVGRALDSALHKLGPELNLLESLPVEEIRELGEPLLDEAIARLRRGQVIRQAGYDGEYGVIHLFEPEELEREVRGAPLFALPDAAPPMAPTPGPAEAPSESESTVEAPSFEDPIPSEPRPPAESGRDPLAGPSVNIDPLGALDPDQRRAAEIVDGHLLIVAGPGAGKTRTLTHRIAHGIRCGRVEPEACLTITFTRRAAEELRNRLETLVPEEASRIPVLTFHGLGLSIVRDEADVLGLPSDPRVIDAAEQESLVRSLFGLSEREARKRLSAFSEIRRAEALGLEDSGADVEIVRELARYLETLRGRGRIDFDDLLILPLTLLARDAGVRERYQHRYRWISVDEYQDIDPLQYRLVRTLVSEGSSLCAIGDPDQSIYAFRGSDVGFFLRFREDFPGARVIQLDRNYRSTGVIVDAALQTLGSRSLIPDRELRAAVEGGPDRIVLHSARTERAEAEFVVHTIERLIGGTSLFSVDSGRVDHEDDAALERSALAFSDFAVLYRTDALTPPLVEALDRSGIPFQKMGHRPLADDPGVRALVAELRALCDRDDAKPSAGGTEAWMDEALSRASASTYPEMRPELERAVELLTPLLRRHPESLPGLLTELAVGFEMESWNPKAERVSLLTLHAAKGLEFPVVFIVGCEEGILPLTWGSSEHGESEAVDEERRLLFVGMTRAERRLYLTHAMRRRWRGEIRERRPSPFLATVEEALIERATSERIRAPRAREEWSDQLELL